RLCPSVAAAGRHGTRFRPRRVSVIAALAAAISGRRRPHHRPPVADAVPLGGGTALVVGLLGSLYGAGGVGQALQHAGDTMWHVPRNSRPNFFPGRFRSLVIIAIAGFAMLLSEVGIAVLHGFFHGSAVSRWLIFVIGLVPATLVLLVAFQGATNRRITWRK